MDTPLRPFGVVGTEFASQFSAARGAVGRSPLGLACGIAVGVSDVFSAQALAASPGKGPAVSVSGPWATGAVCCPAVVAQGHAGWLCASKTFPTERATGGHTGHFRALAREVPGTQWALDKVVFLL